MKSSLPLLIFLPVLVGVILAPMTAQAEHPLVEAAREMQAELERLGFTSEDALIQDFLKWRRQRRQNQDTATIPDDKDSLHPFLPDNTPRRPLGTQLV